MFFSFSLRRYRAVAALFAAALLVACAVLVFFGRGRAEPTAAPLAHEVKIAYLTFDDGPSHVTDAVLAELERYGAKATFFVTGHGAGTPEYAERLRAIRDGGHLIALHTYTHDFSDIYRSTDAFWEDYRLLSEAVFDAAGVNPLIMRFPGGSSNTVAARYGGAGLMTALAEQASERGYVYYDWNVSAGEAERRMSAENIASRTIAQAQRHNEAVILLHDSSTQDTTAQALGAIIEALRAQGYCFDTLDICETPVQHSLD